MRFFLAIVLGLILCTGCAIVPLSKGLSARNLLEGQWELDSQLTLYSDRSGATLSIPSLRAIYGFKEWVNLGVHTEFQTLNVFSRFQILSPGKADGLAVAASAGVVLITGNLSYWVGTIASYELGKIESYLGLFYHLANIDRTRVDISFFKIPPDLRAHFASGTLGLRYWFTGDVAAGLEWVYLANGTGITFPMRSLLSFQLSLVY